MKILLADDDQKIHLIVKLWLARNGHQVESAQNGQEALEKLRAGEFDGLITDVNMPLMRGVDLVKEVVKMEKAPPMIVVLTSRCDISEIKRELSFPTVHLYNKPFSPNGLAELIESLYRGKTCVT